MMSLVAAAQMLWGGLGWHSVATTLGQTVLGGEGLWMALQAGQFGRQTIKDLAAHRFVTGSTGAGKTNCLHHFAVDAVRRNASVVTFHVAREDADHLRAILQAMPQPPQIIVVDPSRPDCPALNLLEIHGPSTPETWHRQAKILRQVFEDDTDMGYIMGQVMEFGAAAVIESAARTGVAPTMAMLMRFLGDTQLRKGKSNHAPSLAWKLLTMVENRAVRDYFATVYPEHAKSALRVLNRLLNFLGDPALQRILTQPHGLDVAALLKKPVVLQVVMDLGDLTCDGVDLFGRMWLSLLTHLTYQRPFTHRLTVILADEWHLYASKALQEAITEGRRHQMSWTLACQHTGQVGTLRQAIGITGSWYVFRPDALEDAPMLARALHLEKEDAKRLAYLPNLTCWARELRRGTLHKPRRMRWAYLDVPTPVQSPSTPRTTSEQLTLELDGEEMV